MPYSDRNKRLEYSRNWNRNYYLAHTDEEKQRIAERRNNVADWYQEFKKRFSCICCNESTSICIDLHHVRGKDFSLGLVKNWGYGKRRILKEISKCIPLCANCHRKVHAGILVIGQLKEHR